jgi:hypothetical protein
MLNTLLPHLTYRGKTESETQHRPAERTILERTILERTILQIACRGKTAT